MRGAAKWGAAWAVWDQGVLHLSRLLLLQVHGHRLSPGLPLHQDRLARRGAGDARRGWAGLGWAGRLAEGERLASRDPEVQVARGGWPLGFRGNRREALHPPRELSLSAPVPLSVSRGARPGRLLPGGPASEWGSASLCSASVRPHPPV